MNKILQIAIIVTLIILNICLVMFFKGKVVKDRYYISSTVMQGTETVLGANVTFIFDRASGKYWYVGFSAGKRYEDGPYKLTEYSTSFSVLK